MTAQAPAYAASTAPAPTATSVSGCTSKTGQNWYDLTLTFDAPLTGHTFSITSVYFGTGSPPTTLVPVVAGPTYPATNQALFTVQSSNNAGNIYIQVNYKIDGQSGTYTTTGKLSVSAACP